MKFYYLPIPICVLFQSHTVIIAHFGKMKCFILAAGYATRLYPLTENFPKPLLKVGNKTILDWLLDDIDQSGAIDQYVVISNHKYVSKFQEWAKDKPYNIIVLDDGTETNETRLGAVKDIQFAIETLKYDGDLLVIAGDNLVDFSLTKFIQYAKEKQTSCVMRYSEPSLTKLQKCGVISIDENEVITKMTEKSPNPETHWICPPFYYYIKEDSQKFKEGIESGCGTDAPGSYLAWLCTQTKIHVMEMPGNRYDIGDLNSYQQIQNEYKGIH